jgi:hypothetical protein
VRPPTIKPTTHRGQPKYRLTLHSDMSGIYSRSEVLELRQQIDRIIAAERATDEHRDK